MTSLSLPLSLPLYFSFSLSLLLCILGTSEVCAGDGLLWVSSAELFGGGREEKPTIPSPCLPDNTGRFKFISPQRLFLEPKTIRENHTEEPPDLVFTSISLPPFLSASQLV